MQFHKEREKILVIDFGSQVTKLIGRNIRDLGVYSEIITPKEFNKLKKFHLIKGIIFQEGHRPLLQKIIKLFQKRYLKKIFQF